MPLIRVVMGSLCYVVKGGLHAELMVVVAVVVVLEKVSDRDVEKAMRAPPPPRTLRCLVFAKWLPRRLLHSWWQRSDRWETTYYRLGVKPWAKKKRLSSFGVACLGAECHELEVQRVACACGGGHQYPSPWHSFLGLVRHPSCEWLY